MPGGAWISPFQATYADYQGRKVTVSITFNPSTLAITNPGLTGNRDVGCVYDRVEIGRPDGTLKVFLIPEGAFTVGRTQLANQGFNLITDVTNANITVGTTEPPT